MTLSDILARGVDALSLSLSDEQQAMLLKYVALLGKWNQAFNLTAVRDPSDMVVRHLLDSLAVLPHVSEDALLDVGTGAGIPGIPLAICRPEQALTLVDSNGKKTRFVKQAATELGLHNVTVVQSRVEQYRMSSPQVISRAFASLPDMVRMTAHLLAPGGRLLAMKATPTDLEVAGLRAAWNIEHIPLTVPMLDEPRQLIVLTRSEDASDDSGNEPGTQSSEEPSQGETL